MAATEEVELRGRVTQVPKDRQVNGVTKFTVLTPESGKKYNCICPFFCPIRPDDKIHAVCEIQPNNTLLIIRPPYVEISMSKENIIKTLITMGKLGFGKAKALYTRLEKTKADPVDHISRLAQKWYTTRDPEILTEFPEFPDSKKCMQFLSKWYKQRLLRRLYLLGFTKKEIRECELDADQIYKQCMKNPMALYGISIERAYEIQERFQEKPTKDDIICGQVLRYIHTNSKERGWSGVPSDMVSRAYPDFPKYKDKLLSEYNLTAELRTVALSRYANIEQETAQIITELMAPQESFIDDPYYGKKIKLSKLQKKAVRMGLREGISIITGGPGTGKTTILKTIVDNLEMMKLRYTLCSFTGKAVARMQEVTGKPAFTIHRFISEIPKMRDNPEHDIIIIDEFSMVTTPLFHTMMTTLRSYEKHWPKILLVGDIDQLPPIDWGDLALCVMKIPQIPRVVLNENMRLFKTLPGEVDGIMENLKMIADRAQDERDNMVRGKPVKKQQPKTVAMPESAHCFEFSDDDDYIDPEDYESNISYGVDSPFTESSNFFLLPGSKELIYDIIIDCHKKGLKQDDITIVSPYNKDLQDLNDKFEQIYHDEKPFIIDHWENKWHIGSRIICLENNYDLPIYNGTEAVVDDFDDDHLKIRTSVMEEVDGEMVNHDKVYDIPLKPKYDGKKRIYNPETDEYMDPGEEFTTKKFALSYALTCHRCQGSQWPYVVVFFPPDKGPSSFISRNLVYTAISRARRAVWCIGNIDSLNASLDTGIGYRHNTLVERVERILKCQ
jgi:hypothetical protein